MTGIPDIRLNARYERLKYHVYLNRNTLSEDIPEDWELQYIDIGNVDSTGAILEKQRMRFGDAPSRARRKVAKGDTIVSTVRTYLKAITYIDSDEDNLVCSTGFAVLTPKKELHPKFLAYYSRSTNFIDEVVSRSVGVSYPAVNASDVVDIKIPIHPLNVQKTISSYLDQRTTKIDQIIEKKKRLIELLQEKRQALITQAVTKGLDPNVQMKDSGIKWLGEVPAHWKIIKVSHVFSGIGSGTTPDSHNVEYYDGNVHWVVTGDLNDGELYETSKRITEAALQTYSSLKLYPPGTLLIAMYGATIGKLAILKTFAATNQACCALYSPKEVDTKYIFYWLLANRRHIISLALGGGQPNISQEIIRNLRVCLPSIDEQMAIIKTIEEKTDQIEKVIEKIEKQVELIQEYRQALITAAVTGQIDIREKMTVSADTIPAGKE